MHQFLKFSSAEKYVLIKIQQYVPHSSYFAVQQGEDWFTTSSIYNWTPIMALQSDKECIQDIAKTICRCYGGILFMCCRSLPAMSMLCARTSPSLLAWHTKIETFQLVTSCNLPWYSNVFFGFLIAARPFLSTDSRGYASYISKTRCSKPLIWHCTFGSFVSGLTKGQHSPLSVFYSFLVDKLL